MNPDRTISAEKRLVHDQRKGNVKNRKEWHPPAQQPVHRQLARLILWWSTVLPHIPTLLSKLDVKGAFKLLWLDPDDVGAFATDFPWHPGARALKGVVVECECDGEDNDCDGDPDEAFPDLGDDCEACGTTGKIECAVDDPMSSICDVYAGQNQAMADPPREECNEVDDDCDGVVDERCALPRGEPLPRSHPAVCGDAVLYVQGEGIVSVQRGHRRG